MTAAESPMTPITLSAHAWRALVDEGASIDGAIENPDGTMLVALSDDVIVELDRRVAAGPHPQPGRRLLVGDPGARPQTRERVVTMRCTRCAWRANEFYASTARRYAGLHTAETGHDTFTTVEHDHESEHAR